MAAYVHSSFHRVYNDCHTLPLAPPQHPLQKTQSELGKERVIASEINASLSILAPVCVLESIEPNLLNHR